MFVKQKYKILGALVLSLFFLLPVLITKVSYEVRLYRIRQEVKDRILQNIADEDLTILSFKRKDIYRLVKWEHDREFEYKDRMFDVVRSVENGDSITYYCWTDVKESTLHQNIEKLVDQVFNQDPIEKRNNKLQLDYFKNVFFQAHQFGISLDRRVVKEYNETIANYNVRYSNIYSIIHSPPPKYT